MNCIQRIKDIEIRKERRSQERKAVNQTSQMKSYKDHDWLGITMEETLKSLKVNELDKYWDHRSLSKKGKKDDKITAFPCKVLRENKSIIIKKSVEISNEESDSDENCYGSDEETCSCFFFFFSD